MEDSRLIATLSTSSLTAVVVGSYRGMPSEQIDELCLWVTIVDGLSSPCPDHKTISLLILIQCYSTGSIHWRLLLGGRRRMC
ncbi:hypothetical protein M3J09_009665 [Ascochyta lentis]